MTTPISLTFDAADPARLAAFWAAALGYEMDAPPEPHATWDDWAHAAEVPEDQRSAWRSIHDPAGTRPALFIQRVPEGKVAKNRLHLDLAASAGAASPEDHRARVDAEVARLKALGASDHRGTHDADGSYWVRMNDPEGNEFCVV